MRLACNGTIVNDTEMGEVIQLQGDQRKDVKEFLTDKKEGLELDAKTIKVSIAANVFTVQYSSYIRFTDSERLVAASISTSVKYFEG